MPTRGPNAPPTSWPGWRQPGTARSRATRVGRPPPGDPRPARPAVTPRPRIVVNALPLDPSGGGVSTYIRELLGALVRVVDADLVAAVRPAGRAELPDGVTPLLLPESRGVRRALAGARGFGSCDLVHGLDVDLPLRRTGLRVATVHDLA